MSRKDLYWILFAYDASLIVAVSIYSFYPIPPENNALYFLSSISQGLAAIFTLIFAITFFGAQTMRKFTAVDRLIDKWTEILMIIFAIGIISPLLQIINQDFITNKIMFSFDIAITTFCILIIIPYFIRVNNILKYEGGISKLSEETSEAIDSNHEATVSYRFKEFSELGKSAVENGDYLEVAKIIDILRKSGKNIIDKRWEKALKEVLNAFLEIGFEANHKKISPNNLVAQLSIEGLKEMSVYSIDNDFADNLIYHSNEYMFQIMSHIRFRGDKNNHLKFIAAKSLIENLMEMANKSYMKKDFLFRWEDVPGKDNNKLIEFLEKNMDLMWNIENIKKANDNNSIILSDGKLNCIYLKLNKEKNIVILTENSDIQSAALIAVKTENNNINIYKYNFRNTLESSLIYLWFLGAFIKKNMPEHALEVAKQFRKLNHQFIEDLFRSDYIRTEIQKKIDFRHLELEKELFAFQELYDKSFVKQSSTNTFWGRLGE